MLPPTLAELRAMNVWAAASKIEEVAAGEPNQGFQPHNVGAQCSVLSRASSAIYRFCNFVDRHQGDILAVAHPSMYSYRHDDRSHSAIVSVERSSDSMAEITDRISWKGPLSGKNYQTTLIFTVSSSGAATIASIDMEVEETNDPVPAAFDIAERLKSKAISVISGWAIKNKIGREVASDVADELLPVKKLFTNALLQIANNQ
jgi:hypothetical protein